MVWVSRSSLFNFNYFIFWVLFHLRPFRECVQVCTSGYKCVQVCTSVYKCANGVSQ